ncbi:MAG: glutamine--fructose-6-phosphate aminotransferase [Candidatus Riflebacteria bacterium HGW-Riflebacteria-1]|jgi:glucosamine 6-phosphate synthetase-like amidotransferase/phosphosugar isomerase protein|nr:MAG: glutamine--fructose-6-phosphate aminotransferase [Candidatus Riflebacteria bacterium HGW-Riflebacteria-1]
MCGVLGLILAKDSEKMGQTACQLLRMLEYRGYDSTGAVIQDEAGNISLRKDVGAPSKVVYELGIDKLVGQIFCGQVRWATFGAVTRDNAQPHEVSCHTHIYGAHNGNITNCSQLKEWLTSFGHKVVSDNDGEMVVHTVEHFFAEELKFKDENNMQDRYDALKNAVVKACQKTTGSFAAIIVDPVARRTVAIKAGSSLYIGQGHNPELGDFYLASSDLASVLNFTKVLIPIKEKQFAIFDSSDFRMYDIRDGSHIEHTCQRSLLKVEETRLQHPYRYFMEQEIFSQSKNTAKLIGLLSGGNDVIKLLRDNATTHVDCYTQISDSLQKLAQVTEHEEFVSRVGELFESPQIAELAQLTRHLDTAKVSLELESGFASLLEDVRKALDEIGGERGSPALIRLIDGIFEFENIKLLEERMREFVDIIVQARNNGDSIYILACGTSFHAAKTAPLFFNEIAGISVTPLLPGEFRAQCTRSLGASDVVIGISQSGETKDLIDVFSFLEEMYPGVKRICILNNTNSTLALEKSHIYVPLFCGPEIAVPATKSFLNQLLVLYALALEVKSRLEKAGDAKIGDGLPASFHFEEMKKIPGLIDMTLKTTQQETEMVAGQLYLKPSMHILATRILGIAKEGALKIREIVLNHTEGFEGSEFKHGPNTILGLNSVFGLDAVAELMTKLEEVLNFVLENKKGEPLKPRGVLRMFKAISEYAFKDLPPNYLSVEEREVFDEVFKHFNVFGSLYDNYPLIFITTPRKRDINLTISQINTHKIRGANVYLIAEDNNELREAVSVAPATTYPYKYGYITIPRTDSKILPIFSITVVLQMLAFKMSLKKMEFMDRLEIASHGVHPDVPKNVSKSITVD